MTEEKENTFEQQMLYKHPGIHEIHGDKFDTLIVDSVEELEEALEDGWFETTPEALDNSDNNVNSSSDEDVDETTPPTREEVLQKAQELGVEFKTNTTTTVILKRIEEKLAESE